MGRRRWNVAQGGENERGGEKKESKEGRKGARQIRMTGIPKLNHGEVEESGPRSRSRGGKISILRSKKRLSWGEGLKGERRKGMKGGRSRLARGVRENDILGNKKKEKTRDESLQGSGYPERID